MDRAARELLKEAYGGGKRGKRRGPLPPAAEWPLSLLFLLGWGLAIGYISLYYASVTLGPELYDSYFTVEKLPLLNLLPPVLLALLLFGVFNRVWPAVLISGLVVLGGSFANYFMLMTRTETLLAADLRYIKEAAGIGSRYEIVPTPGMWWCFAMLAAATLLSLFFLKARFTHWLPRALFPLLAAGACAWAWFGLYTDAELYAKTENLNVEFASGYVMSEGSDTDKYAGRGFLYPFLYSLNDLGPKKPEGYRKADAAAALAAYPSSDIPEEKKVDVIAVMLEAYTDLSVYENLQVGSWGVDPYAYFHQLQYESFHGDILTNIFAGGTIDTERCFITGSTELYDYRGPADSYARWLTGQGYHTTFCHAGYSWFYNRRNVAENLGFEESYFSDGWFEDRCEDTIPTDAEFFPALLELYREHKRDGQPYFNFSVTYQNHGPYASTYFLTPTTAFLNGTDLTPESYHILNNYLYGIYQTDQAIASFIETLRWQADPVVVVLFGDHKPWLGDNSSVYEEVGIDLKWKTGKTFDNIYRTQYVVWANEAAKQQLGVDFCGFSGDFSPCFLMMLLHDACGWAGDSNMAAMRELYAQVDVIHEKGCRKSGKYLREMPAETQALIDQYKSFEFYRMRDAMR